MGRFDTIKTTIDANIKENGNQEITGQKMNSILTEMVNATDAELTELESETGAIRNLYVDQKENISLSLGGYYVPSGNFKENDYVLSSAMIPVDSGAKIYYRLALANVGYIVSFFDANKNLLHNISILGESANTPKEGVIDTSGEDYANIAFVFFSHYNGYTDLKEYARVIGKDYDRNNDTRVIADLLAANDINCSFELTGYYNGNGAYVNYANMVMTRKYPVNSRLKLDCQLFGNSSASCIAFFDENGDFLEDVSIKGEGNGAWMNKEIDLSDAAYSEVRYVAFSHYLIGGNYHAYIKGFLPEYMPSIINLIKSKGLEVTLDQPYFIASGGKPSMNESCLSSSKIIFERGMKIEASLALNSNGYAVAFYDKWGELIRSISVVVSDTTAAKQKTIVLDTSGEEYAKAVYVSFSHYLPGFPNYYARIKGEDNVSFMQGQNLMALGDSITDGVGNSSYSWFDMLTKRYGTQATSYNFAETGECLRTMADLCTAENMKDIDIVIVAGGTNQLSNYRLGTLLDDATPDRWQPNTTYKVGDKVLGGTLEKHGWTTPIYAYLYWYECVSAGTSGSESDASHFPITTDEEFTDGSVRWRCVGSPSWYSDMKGICRRVWGFNPGVRIIWIIPIKTRYDVGWLPEKWQRAEKFNAIRDFCEFNSIQTIDLQKEFPLNEWTENAIMADDLHPNERGYEIIRDIVASHIE